MTPIDPVVPDPAGAPADPSRAERPAEPQIPYADPYAAGRVVVTGATGNLGSAIVPALLAAGYHVVSITRHRPSDPAWEALPGVEWRTADIGLDPFDPAWFEGADAVIHLAWAIQPSHRPEEMFRTNVVGSRCVFEAAVAAGVPHLVHASSLGAYAAAPKGATANETYPSDGSPVLDYSWQKAYVERILDLLEREHPEVVVTRLRPALVLGAGQADRIHGLFGGRVPKTLVAMLVGQAARAPVPFQVVHTDDVAEAVVRVLEARPSGAINLAATPVMGGSPPAGRAAMRTVAAATTLPWRLRIVASDPGWIRLAATAPVLDTSRAREELGWTPAWDAPEVLADFARGLRQGAPVLRPAAPIPA